MSGKTKSKRVITPTHNGVLLTGLTASNILDIKYTLESENNATTYDLEIDDAGDLFIEAIDGDMVTFSTELPDNEPPMYWGDTSNVSFDYYYSNPVNTPTVTSDNGYLYKCEELIDVDGDTLSVEFDRLDLMFYLWADDFTSQYGNSYMTRVLYTKFTLLSLAIGDTPSDETHKVVFNEKEITKSHYMEGRGKSMLDLRTELLNYTSVEGVDAGDKYVVLKVRVELQDKDKQPLEREATDYFPADGFREIVWHGGSITVNPTPTNGKEV